MSWPPRWARPAAWIARAARSLPVPGSPVIRTGAAPSAAAAMSRYRAGKQGVLGHGGVDRSPQRVVDQRLGEIVRRAQLHGGHGVDDGAVAGEHQRHDVGGHCG